MKQVHIIILAVYFFLAIFLTALNWELFTTNMEVSLGFTSFYFPFVSIIFLVSFILLLLQWGLARFQEGNLQKKLQHKENEMRSLKSDLLDEQAPHIGDIVANFGYLDQKVNKIIEALKIDNPESEPEIEDDK